jgi:hypothetical protein
MIKAPDRKPTTSTAACFEEASESVLGIVFEKRDGPQRFAPYAFLSAVDYNGRDELTFHFSIGEIIVRGKGLETLWRAACQGELARVWESEKPSTLEAAWVRELYFYDADQEPDIQVPPFPSAS